MRLTLMQKFRNMGKWRWLVAAVAFVMAVAVATPLAAQATPLSTSTQTAQTTATSGTVYAPGMSAKRMAAMSSLSTRTYVAKASVVGTHLRIKGTFTCSGKRLLSYSWRGTASYTQKQFGPDRHWTWTKKTAIGGWTCHYHWLRGHWIGRTTLRPTIYTAATTA